MGTVRLAALGHASAGEIAAILTEIEATSLVEAIRSSTDDEILALLHDADRGPSVVEGVTQRIGELAVPAQLAGVDFRVRWECAAPAIDVTVHVHDGTARPVSGSAVAKVDVVVRGSGLQLLRLVAGQLDVAVAYLGGELSLHGRADVALALAGLFAADPTPPVTGRPVDPRDIDPLAIARALHGVSTDHLRSVLASDFRAVILEEIFERMPAHVNGRKAAGVQITVGFRLTGRPDGEVDRFVLRLSDGQATVLAGEAADAVDRSDRHATVTCEAHDFLRLATGHLNVVTGVLRGQLKVRGDKAAALRFNSAFDIPTAAA